MQKGGPASCFSLSVPRFVVLQWLYYHCKRGDATFSPPFSFQFPLPSVPHPVGAARAPGGGTRRAPTSSGPRSRANSPPARPPGSDGCFRLSYGFNPPPPGLKEEHYSDPWAWTLYQARLMSLFACNHPKGAYVDLRLGAQGL